MSSKELKIQISLEPISLPKKNPTVFILANSIILNLSAPMPSRDFEYDLVTHMPTLFPKNEVLSYPNLISDVMIRLSSDITGREDIKNNISQKANVI